MRKLLATGDLGPLKNAKKLGKIILVGGCFDILHPGHRTFLSRAKALGTTLVVMLESDKKVRNLKGERRPINSQDIRAQSLSSLSEVDYVILLPYLEKNKDYEILVKNLEPDIIAVTEGEMVYDWEKSYMKKTGGKIVQVVKRLKNYSTTKLAESIKL
jgi:D-beta-D-heptose 7-phosphate kinase/D-beta-D-heptose 1-phosphate adenosyltransferase